MVLNSSVFNSHSKYQSATSNEAEAFHSFKLDIIQQPLHARAFGKSQKGEQYISQKIWLVSASFQFQYPKQAKKPITSV